MAENLHYNDKNRVFGSLSTFGKIKYLLRKKVIVPLLIGNKKKKRFEEFRQKHLKQSAQKWTTKEDLLANPPCYDVYVSGSDQIWNPDVIVNDYNYLLAFAPDDKKKVAYASSFGKAEIPESKREIYQKYLSRYSEIGVREESGTRLVQDLTGKACTTVLDPTLLLTKDEWAQFAKENKEEEPYVLCYYMPGDDTVCNAIASIAQRISEQKGLKIINLGLKEHYRLKRNFDFRATAGPEEFLTLFLHADYVVTNSFHGTAFATNFHKQLYVPINTALDSKKARHTRITDYLRLIGLEEATVPIVPDSKPLNFTLKEIDYENAGRVLEKKREESIEFLAHAISGEEV